MRYFNNPFPPVQSGSVVSIDSAQIKKLIETYVNKIVQHKNYSDGDLYVGTSGISFMFLKLHQSQAVLSLNSSSLDNAKIFIERSKKHLRSKPEKAASFLCGNAGIYSVSAIVNLKQSNDHEVQRDINQFLKGVSACLKLKLNNYGSDEILFGRAGYLSGCYWLNQMLPSAPRISSDIITQICDVMIESGVQYSRHHNLQIPMMWECYGDKYLGAAHGLSAILHMMLESPLFNSTQVQLNPKQQIVKDSVDAFLQMQSPDGNFPCTLEDASKTEHKLVHWCHGGSGAVYLLAKAFLIFKDSKYLASCIRVGDLVWNKGLLRKGPGICHGVAGSGYVFLLLYRLTSDQKHLYRAAKFAEFLTHEEFLREARTPDRPFSLYEGVAGTVCFLVDLLQPEKASFPFMDVFEVKY